MKMNSITKLSSNKKSSIYYHSDERLDGWSLQGMYPLNNNLLPLFGKTIRSTVSNSSTNVQTNKRSLESDSEPIKSSKPSKLPKPTVTESLRSNSNNTESLSNKYHQTNNSNQVIDLNVPNSKNTTSFWFMKKDQQLPAAINLTVEEFQSDSSDKESNLEKTRSQRRTLPKVSQISTSAEGSNQNSEYYVPLSEEQKRIHDIVVDQKKSIFFTGSAGTGKSVLLRAIIKTLQSRFQSYEVAVTAPTGIAALNIGGTTLNRFAYIGLGDESAHTYIQKIKASDDKLRNWLRVKVLIVDEISMVDGKLLDLVETIARSVRNTDKPFGGIQVVFCGDFFQLPPVDNKCLAFQARCWKKVVEVNMLLKTFFRQKDERFVKILNELRVGYVSEESKSIFKSLSRKPKTIMNIVPTELYATKIQVNKANMERLSLLSGECIKFHATDRGSASFLDKCVAPKQLTLKVGAQVMLIKNLSPTLVNGSIGIVTGFTKASKESGAVFPRVKFTSGVEQVLFEQVWDTDGPGMYSSRKQIPLLLAWAMSIHKAQGKTIEYVKVNLKNVFEAGQTYTALSRATSLDKLQVLNFEPELVRADARVARFYKSLLTVE